MQKKKFAVIFSGFVFVLIGMIVLPSVLFGINDYSLINRVKIEDFDFSDDEFSEVKSLSTEESLDLICREINDDGNIAVIDNSGAFGDTQKEIIFKSMCDELSHMQEIGAFPKFDISGVSMLKFTVTTCIDISNTDNYVKTAYIAAQNSNISFQATMDMNTGYIYYYSVANADNPKELDIVELIKSFSNYLGISFDISANGNDVVYDAEYGAASTYGGSYIMFSNSGVEYNVVYTDDSIIFELMPK